MKILIFLGLILYQTQATFGCEYLKYNFDDLKTSFKENERRFKALLEIEPSEEIVQKNFGPIKKIHRGILRSYEIFVSTGERIYRHWTTPEIKEAIKKNGYLLAGHKPSAVFDGDYAQINEDLYGVFLQILYREEKQMDWFQLILNC
ncbi:MAG: hypothetical protein H6621_06505 [Halobacteriovoraceae bacterium]|nr:hypothetical protein [Halobacteriovoraceae bacterium]